MNFREKGGGGHANPKHFVAGQRPFGLYPKIHPIWKTRSSLREVVKSKKMTRNLFVARYFVQFSYK